MADIFVALADRCGTFSYTSGFTLMPCGQWLISFNGFIHHLPNQSKGLANQVLPIKSIRLPPARESLHLGAIYFRLDGWGGGGRGHSMMMPCVHNLPLPGKRREDTRAVTVETDNNNNIQKSSGKSRKYM